MSDFQQYSRVHKLEKRRKHKRVLLLLMSFASCLIVLFVFFTWIYNSEEPQTANEAEDQNDFTSQETNTENNENDLQAPEHDLYPDMQDEDDVNNDNEVDMLTPIDTNDDLVIEAYSGQWEPIGTIQEEPHVTQFDKESQDWHEMEQAIRFVTGLEDMITWWIGNDGEQKVVGTVSSTDQQDIFRVYLRWITHEGWQPTKVERLKEIPQ